MVKFFLIPFQEGKEGKPKMRHNIYCAGVKITVKMLDYDYSILEQKK